MIDRRVRIVASARACIGTRYRPQGRQAGEALDCVGLAALAIGAVRPISTPPADYDLCADHGDRLINTLTSMGLVERYDQQIVAGDMLVFQPGIARQHLAIATDEGFVHAHLGLRKVVEAPWPALWPLLSVWII